MKTKRCMAGLLMLVLCAGIQLHAQQNVTNSVESLKAKAETGDAQSQFVLGGIYECGSHGMTQNINEAMKWFRKAADQNFAPAQYELGIHFANGQGVKRDEAEAVKWYLKAANLNLAVAQYNLGVCYRDGQGVAKNVEEAVIWFRKAADQNLAMAQYNLGVCYDNGQGVAKDIMKAVNWYRKAAEQNLAYAQCNLGAHYERGAGVGEDHAEAVKWYRKAAEQNYALAQYNLGACYANSRGVAKNEIEALMWYRKAADQGFAFAQCNLGVCYANGQGVVKDAVEAVKWFRKAADQNDSAAQYSLGTCYYNGLGIKQNDVEAYIWFSLSAAQGDVDAAQARKSITSLLSRAEIAAAQKRIVAFVPRKANAEQVGLNSINSLPLLNQLSYVPLPEAVKQDAERASPNEGIVANLPKSISVRGVTRNGVNSAVTIQSGAKVYTVFLEEATLVQTPEGPVSVRFAKLGTNTLILEINGEPAKYQIINQTNSSKADTEAPPPQEPKTNSDPTQNPQEEKAHQSPAQRSTVSNPNQNLTQNGKLTQEDIKYLQSQGIDPANVTVQETQQPQGHGIAFMDSFLGIKNFCIPSDNVISMKTEALRFQINGKNYDYSGHYAVMLNTPRKHTNPVFGFGTPEKAKLIIIDNFGGQPMPLPDATIWEKSSGFIDVEALGKEWIYSGTYTIQK